jgi:NAD+ diphosphatase
MEGIITQILRQIIIKKVGITVKNINYFGSQPWPFPDALMIGFTAGYNSGEIVIDGMEIEAAD